MRLRRRLIIIIISFFFFSPPFGLNVQRRPLEVLDLEPVSADSVLSIQSFYIVCVFWSVLPSKQEH